MEKLGKTNYLVSVSFSLIIGMVVRKVVALSAVSKCEFYALPCEITSIICITYQLDSIFHTSFCKYVKWRPGKEENVFDFQSGKNQGIVREFQFTYWV